MLALSSLSSIEQGYKQCFTCRVLCHGRMTFALRLRGYGMCGVGCACAQVCQQKSADRSLQGTSGDQSLHGIVNVYAAVHKGSGSSTLA